MPGTVLKIYVSERKIYYCGPLFQSQLGGMGKASLDPRRMRWRGWGRKGGTPLKHRGGLITRVARSSFTYRGRYTLAYFKPAIFQHLRYTSTSNLHEPTIRDLFRPTFGVSARRDAARKVLSWPLCDDRPSTLNEDHSFSVYSQFTKLIIVLFFGLFIC